MSKKSERTIKSKDNLRGAEPKINEEKGFSSVHKFPIVGIGASAGGLDALKKFFSNVPPNNGMGYVVIQHMDPHYKSNLAAILNGYTSMDAIQIKDGMKVEPEHVYVIPPDNDLSILNGKLLLLKSTKPHGVRNPIDFFFKSLAEDQNGEHIIPHFQGVHE